MWTSAWANNFLRQSKCRRRRLHDLHVCSAPTADQHKHCAKSQSCCSLVYRRCWWQQSNSSQLGSTSFTAMPTHRHASQPSYGWNGLPYCVWVTRKGLCCVTDDTKNFFLAAAALTRSFVVWPAAVQSNPPPLNTLNGRRQASVMSNTAASGCQQQ